MPRRGAVQGLSPLDAGMLWLHYTALTVRTQPTNRFRSFVTASPLPKAPKAAASRPPWAAYGQNTLLGALAAGQFFVRLKNLPDSASGFSPEPLNHLLLTMVVPRSGSFRGRTEPLEQHFKPPLAPHAKRMISPAVPFKPALSSTAAGRPDDFQHTFFGGASWPPLSFRVSPKTPKPPPEGSLSFQTGVGSALGAMRRTNLDGSALPPDSSAEALRSLRDYFVSSDAPESFSSAPLGSEAASPLFSSGCSALAFSAFSASILSTSAALPKHSLPPSR